jgi:multiple sugar transport system permease protein
MTSTSASEQAGGDHRRSRASGQQGSGLVPYVFLAPAGVLFVLFMVAPIAYTVYLSVVREQVSGLGLGGGARRTVFVGLDIYATVVADAQLWRSGGRVLIYGLLLVPTMLGLALLFALLLDVPRVRFARFARLSIFLPYAVPGVLATVLWGFLYLPSVSPLHDALRWLGLPDVDLLSGTTIFGALANIGVWGGTGFNMIVIFTALRAVPREMYEAARVDGCTEWQLAWRIKIPMVTPALVLTAVFAIITTLQVFSEPTTLSPLTNTIPSSWSPLMKIYRDAFARNNINIAAATSIIVAIVTLVFSFGFLRIVRSQAFAEDRG